MKTHSFESRGERVITFGRGATLLGVSYGVLRTAAVRDHYRLNGLIWTLAESELASHHAEVPFTRGRTSLVVITEQALRYLAEHFDTPAALAIVNDETPLAAFYDQPDADELQLTPEQLAEAERQLAAIRERYKDHQPKENTLPDGYRDFAELVEESPLNWKTCLTIVRLYKLEMIDGHQLENPRTLGYSLESKPITGVHEKAFKSAEAEMIEEIRKEEKRKVLPAQK